MNRKRGRILAAAAGACFCIGLASNAAAQTWNNPAGGDWFDAGNWSNENIPDSSGESAVIALPGTYTVTLDQSDIIGSLQLGSPGATLQILAGNHGHVTLESHSIDVQYGTLELTSTGGGWGAMIDVGTGGVLYNASRLLISPGTAGPRSISGQTFQNATSGLVEVNADLLIDTLSTYNTGSILIADDRALRIGSNDVFQMLGGSIAFKTGGLNNGRVIVDGGTFIHSDGAVTAPVELVGNNPSLSLPVANAGNATYTFHANGRISGDIASGARVIVEGNGGFGSLTTTLNSSAFNFGTLTLTSRDGGWSSSLSVAGAGTMSNAGAIRFEPGAGGSRAIHATSFTNAQFATLAVNTSTTLSTALTNSGDIALANGTTLSLGLRDNTPVDVHNTDTGTIRTTTPAGSGRVVFSSGVFHLDGGEVSANFELHDDATLDTQATDGSNSRFTFVNHGTLGQGPNPQLPPRTSVWATGNGAYGSITLEVAPGMTNRGAIHLTSTDGAWASTLNNKGAMNNLGIIAIDAGAGGQRIVNASGASGASLVNAGSIQVNQSATFTGALGNTGAISIAAGQVLTFAQNSSLTTAIGAITGPGTIDVYGGTIDHLDGHLATGVYFRGGANNVLRARSQGDAAYPRARFYIRAATTLEDNLGIGDNVYVEGNGSAGHVTLNTPGDLGVGGGLVLSSLDGGWYSTLNVGPTGTHTLLNFGSILANAGAGGKRIINAGNFVNYGWLVVAADTTLNTNTINLGYLMIGNGVNLTVPLGKSWTNAGYSVIGTGGQVALAASEQPNTGAYLLGAGSSLSGPALNFSGNNAGLVVAPGANVALSNLQLDLGAKIVATGGGNIVATGGGNIVATGGGNIVASGAGNLITNDGGSLHYGGSGHGGGDGGFEPTLVAGNGTFTAATMVLYAGAELRPGDLASVPDVAAPSDPDAMPTPPGTNLSPAGGRGTLNIVGDLLMYPGSGLRITFDNTSSDRVVVSKNATLAGVVNFEHMAGYVPVARTAYTVVTAGAGGTGTLSGGFSGVGGYDLGSNLWLGQQSAASFVVTIAGDFNLDYTVNFDDLLVLAQHYGQPSGAAWATGDSNYDAAVNFDDLLLLAQHYSASAVIDAGAFTGNFAADWALARSLVPEPTALAVALLPMLADRRRR